MENTISEQQGGSSGGFLDPRKVVAEFGFTEGMKIADFGCGSGEFAILIAKMTGETGVVTAVDIIESRLESVRAKAKFAGLNNIQTIRSNLEVLGSSGLADSSQDIAVLANVLFQNPKKAEIITEAHRVLKDNGKLIVIDWKENSGGLGPSAEFKNNVEDMKTLVTGLDFTFEHDIDAGAFHYGLVFKQSSKSLP